MVILKSTMIIFIEDNTLGIIGKNHSQNHG